MRKYASSDPDEILARAARLGVSANELAKWLGLSEAEFSRYTALGIVKISIVEVAECNRVSEVIVKFGNKVLTATHQPDGSAIEYKIRFLRGKRSFKQTTGR